MKKLKLIMLSIVFIAVVFGCTNPVGIDSKPDLSGNSLLIDDGDYYVLGGDILFDKNDPIDQIIINDLLNTNDSSTPFQSSSTASRGVSLSKDKQWSGGMVWYIFSGNFTAAELNSIYSAMRRIESVCGVQFRDASGYTSAQGRLMTAYRVKIEKTAPDGKTAGSATVGKATNAIYKVISTNYGVILHELCHVLGMVHEHQRYDRNDFVKVNTNNIDPNYKDNFTTVPKTKKQYYNFLWWKWSKDVTNSTLYGSYDYGSIMHYGTYAFSINGLPTIDSHGNAIGQRNDLSRTDILSLQKMYGK